MDQPKYFYKCDPILNKECEKTSCQNECIFTTKKEYSKDGKKYIAIDCEFVECKEPTTKNNLVVDCIDRQATLEIDWLEQEPRWIPVSERMPEPNRLVLCYITTGATETYFLALWNDTLNAWEEGIGGYRLLENDLGYKVIAWLPLPEPYSEVEE